MITVGDYQIDRAVEYEGPFLRPEELLIGYDPTVLERSRDWLGHTIDPVTGQMRMSFHSFVLRTGRHTILIDTCMGNDKERPLRPIGHRRNTDFLGSLSERGVKPEEVDFVMCTHLHWDHVGWNTRLQDGRWVPTFPNARYIIARTEFDYRDALHAKGDRSMHGLAFADSILPLVHAERAIVVDDDHALEEGVWLQPYPGHTPGTVVINIQSRGGRGVFAGDVLHTPLQLACPELSSIACHDPDLSHISRRRFIEQHVDTGNLIMPAHFLAPSAGCIISRGDAFGFVDTATPSGQKVS
jgi:glyoxylase-like metal-dependent hydrolase (beta-lactamase superfamily II)